MADEFEKLKPYISSINTLINQSHVVLPKKTEIKLYHHHGVNYFVEVGATFVSVIQHDYCKFVVTMMPGQTYPLHYHRIKDETFFILLGDLTVTIEDETFLLYKGDILNIPRRFMHSFSTKNGCVFEEISTAYLQNDSVYEDNIVSQIPKNARVTMMPIEALLCNDTEVCEKLC